MLKPEILASWPPGGWEFYQPETGWHAPKPLVYTFKQQVENIINMRRSNSRFGLAVDYQTVANELDAYTSKRLAYHSKFCIESDDKKKAHTLSPLLRKPAEVAAAALHVDPDALLDWLGEGGKPVDSKVSEWRASVCAGCDEENQKKGWRDLLTAPAAESLRIYIGIKHRMNLETPFDSKLGVCKACHCHLGLKVHVPKTHIMANTKQEVLDKLPKHCWILKP